LTSEKAKGCWHQRFGSLPKSVKVILFTLIWGLLILTLWENGFTMLWRMDLRARDSFFHWRGPQPRPRGIIALTDDGQDNFSDDHYNRFPRPRDLYASAITKLVDAGAKVVAIDVLFEREGANPDEDKSLSDAISRYANHLVLGFQVVEEEGLIRHGLSPLIRSNAYRVSGSVNLERDEDIDHRVRRISFGGEDAIGQYRSFAALTAEKYLGIASMAFPQGDVYINYPGDGWPKANELELWKLFEKRAWNGELKSGSVFSNKIVLIGSTSAALHDLHMTPVGLMPGVELQADRIATILGNSYLVDTPRWITRVAVIAAALMTGLLLLTAGHPAGKLFLVAAICIVYYLLAVETFIQRGVFLAVAPVVCTVAGSGIIEISAELTSEQWERRRLRQKLSVYVSEPVAAEILRRGDQYQQGLTGENRDAAVLFSDIRNFTTISERSDPADLVKRLNEYFSHMVAIIKANNGTVSKFIGDGIMALYGVPLSFGSQQDVRNAINTALQMTEKVKELQHIWDGSDFQLRIGIAISYGSVIAGDIGSLDRKEYTVMGDVVNVSSRVESLNKELSTEILITDTTFQQIAGEVDVVDKGERFVKGREQPVRVYEVRGWKEGRSGEAATSG
jgi:adenylate cyclase